MPNNNNWYIDVNHKKSKSYITGPMQD